MHTAEAIGCTAGIFSTVSRPWSQLTSPLLPWLVPCIVEHKFCAQEVAADLSRKVRAVPRRVGSIQRDDVVGRPALLALARRQQEPALWQEPCLMPCCSPEVSADLALA